MTFDLRSYQNDLFSDARNAFAAGHQGVVLALACGGGKTPIIGRAAERSAKKGNHVIVTMPRKELLRQTAKTFDSMGIPYGYIASGMSPNPFAQIKLASMGTLIKRYEKYQPSFLIVDEGHFALAPGQRKVIDHYMAQGCKVLLLTASPERLDGKGLGQICTALVEGPKVSWLMQHGYLSQYKAYAPSRPELAGVHSRMGDYALNELTDAMDKPTITGLATDAWGKLARGRRTICYCVSIAHSKHTVDRFNASGIPAEHMDGDTPDHERQAIIRRFAGGQTMVLSNVEICTVGFDLSAQIGQEVPIEAVSLLRPTQSRALHIQMVGRALRMKEHPAIILDHANSLMTHGLPDDPIEWSLEGRGRNAGAAGERTIPTVVCANCFAIFRPQPCCPECGVRREIEGRMVDEVEGELAEIDVLAWRELQKAREAELAKRELQKEDKDCHTLREWMVLAHRRGYKSGWGIHRFNAKRDKMIKYGTWKAEWDTQRTDA